MTWQGWAGDGNVHGYSQLVKLTGEPVRGKRMGLLGIEATGAAGGVRSHLQPRPLLRRTVVLPGGFDQDQAAQSAKSTLNHALQEDSRERLT